MKPTLKSLQTDVHSLQAGLHSVQTDVHSLQVGLRSVQADVHSLQLRMDHVSTKLDNHIADTNFRFREVFARFDEVDERFDKLETRLDRLPGEFMNCLDNYLDTVEQRLRDHDNRISALEKPKNPGS